MNPTRNIAAVGGTSRKPRCRLLNELGDRCLNPSLDPDPGAVQICPSHALKGAQLLEEAGAITIYFALPSSMRSTT